MGINKKMPSQEIGLYRMAKEIKAMKETKKTVSHMMNMASAIAMSDEMKSPTHRILIKKK